MTAPAHDDDPTRRRVAAALVGATLGAWAASGLARWLGRDQLEQLRVGDAFPGTEERAAFESSTSNPHTLDDYGRRLSELPASEVSRLDERWQREVLRSN